MRLPEPDMRLREPDMRLPEPDMRLREPDMKRYEILAHLLISFHIWLISFISGSDYWEI